MTGGLSERANGEGRTCGRRKQLEMKTYPPQKGNTEDEGGGQSEGQQYWWKDD